MMMKGKTFCFIFLILILMTLIIPCLGAAPKKGGKQSNSKPAAPVNKQKEKDKQAKKEIREYVTKTQELVNGPINEATTLIAIFVFSASLVSLLMFGSFLVKGMNVVISIALFVLLELWLYQNMEDSIVRVFWEYYKLFQNTSSVKTEL